MAELPCPNAVAVKATETANVICKVTDLGFGLVDFVAWEVVEVAVTSSLSAVFHMVEDTRVWSGYEFLAVSVGRFIADLESAKVPVAIRAA